MDRQKLAMRGSLVFAMFLVLIVGYYIGYYLGFEDAIFMDTFLFECNLTHDIPFEECERMFEAGESLNPLRKE